MKILVVGGNFNSSGGKSSSIINKIINVLSDEFGEDNVVSLNGGTLEELNSSVKEFKDVIFWAPNVSNDLEKILPDIKKKYPKTLLISTKRVIEKYYTEFDVIGRLLKSKSNLGLMITKDEDLYNFKLLDPLGNCYISSSNIQDIALVLSKRIKELKGLTRISSIQIGENRNIQVNPEFIEYIKYTAEQFTHYVNAINPNRMLGNASTRCMFGFPAQKNSNGIYVTQRNIDKALISTNGFVEVTNNESQVEYYGDKKPSVDTPIQIKLFNYFNNINYMVHGHVYLKNVPITIKKIPCGFIEEFDEIVDIFSDRDITSFAINLKGHGCLIMAQQVSQLWHYKDFCSRQFPEF